MDKYKASKQNLDGRMMILNINKLGYTSVFNRI